jgi:hypothetical protein
MVREILQDSVALPFLEIIDCPVRTGEAEAVKQSSDRRPDDLPSYPSGEECGGEDDTYQDRQSDDECQK